MQWMHKFTTFIVALSLLFLNQSTLAASLTLQKAEHLALARAPELKQLGASQRALEETSIAVEQLSDPKLFLGAQNLPTDTFSFNQTDMTQLQIGIQQTFPSGHTRKYRSQEKSGLAQAEQEKGIVMRDNILRYVRFDWLDLYYWFQTKRIVIQKKRIFQHLLKVTESLLANNKAQQMDVIRAQLEVSSLDNRLLIISQHIDIVRSKLARWIGKYKAQTANPTRLPHWKPPPLFLHLQRQIIRHPVLRVDQAIIAAHRADVKWAEQQFKPGFSLGAAYGFREGHTASGRSRSDLLTVQASVGLPFFPKNRQDRQLTAKQKDLVASEENRISDYRQLQEVLRAQYAVWHQTRKSSWLYRRRLIPESKQYAEATLISYQNALTDFSTLARSYVRELETQLAGLKIMVDWSKARVNLLYLQGK